MNRREGAPREALPQNTLFEASIIAQRYMYQPERSNPIVSLFRSSSILYEDRSLENNLQATMELAFQEHDMTELEGYYLAFFAGQKVKNNRDIQRATAQKRSSESILQVKHAELDNHFQKMVTADKAFELYGKLVAKHHGVSGQGVHDWFVRMRIAGTRIGQGLHLPLSEVGEEIVEKAAIEVSARRVPGLHLERRELKRLLALEDKRDPMLDIIK